MQKPVRKNVSLTFAVDKTFKNFDSYTPAGYDSDTTTPNTLSFISTPCSYQDFEDDFEIVDPDTILGEGCSSVVKQCIKKTKSFNGNKLNSMNPTNQNLLQTKPRLF